MSTITRGPTVHTVEVRHGIAGQVSASVVHQYPFDDLPSLTVFVGNIYGFMVVMVTGVWEVRVDEPLRFGRFADDPEAWARRFFANT